MLGKDINFFSLFFLRISGNAASDKNIKDGVCAQIEKNFAKAKWKVRLLDHHVEAFLHDLTLFDLLSQFSLQINDFLFSNLQFCTSLFLQKAVRVTTLMKRLRASEQGDTGTSGLVAGATGGPADPNMPSGTVAGPAGGGSLLAASIKTALSEKTTSVPALPQPPAAQPEQQQQQQARCNGDVPQMLPQRKGY